MHLEILTSQLSSSKMHTNKDRKFTKEGKWAYHRDQVAALPEDLKYGRCLWPGVTKVPGWIPGNLNPH